MRKRFWLNIGIISVIIAGVMIYAHFDLKKKARAQKQGDAVSYPDVTRPKPKKEKSPYSLKWESKLAKVVDQQGNGVAGATVTFTKNLRENCKGVPTVEAPEWQGAVAMTDEKGQFEIPEIIWQLKEGQEKPTSHYDYINVDIEADGFLPRRSVTVGQNYADDTGHVDIFRASRIEGVAINPEGEPLKNASLRLRTRTKYKNPNSSCGGCFGSIATTDEQGIFVFKDVPPGDHTIKFPGGGSCRPASSIEFGEYHTYKQVKVADRQMVDDVFFDMRQKRTKITGMVLDMQNRPMAGVRANLSKQFIQYHDNGGGHSTTTVNMNYATTDENGKYAINHVPVGDYQIKAAYSNEKGRNYRSGDRLDIYIAGAGEVSYDLFLERQDGSEPKCGEERSVFAEPLPEGLGENEFMVVGRTGTPIAGAKVVFDGKITIEDHESGTDKRVDWPGATVYTDERGAFELSKQIIAVKDAWVRSYINIEASGYKARHVGLGPYHTKERRIDLRGLGKIRGSFIGSDGKAVAGHVYIVSGAVSYLNPQSMSSGGGSGSKISYQKDGFTVSNVGVGKYLLRYSVPIDEKNKHKGAVMTDVVAGETAELVIDIRQDTGKISGRVIGRDGKAVKGAQVNLNKKITFGYRNSSSTTTQLYLSEKTNRKGEFVIENIRPGIYEVDAVLDGKINKRSRMMRISIGPDSPVEMDIRLDR